jgi:hypothetical protein
MDKPFCSGICESANKNALAQQKYLSNPLSDTSQLDRIEQAIEHLASEQENRFRLQAEWYANIEAMIQSKDG